MLYRQLSTLTYSKIVLNLVISVKEYEWFILAFFIMYDNMNLLIERLFIVDCTLHHYIHQRIDGLTEGRIYL